MVETIQHAIDQFGLDLKGINVLTEAATGNYTATPVIAAKAGARVVAYTQHSDYGTVDQVKKQTQALERLLNLKNNIQIVDSLESIDLEAIHILTNTGFLRPIHRQVIDRLSSRCVIPLMMEPWEFRKEDIDLMACRQKGLKVYGTNENDPRLKTFDYVGYIALYWLLHHQCSPFSAKVLILGSKKFTDPIHKLLLQNYYSCRVVNHYRKLSNPSEYNVIITAEHTNPLCLIGDDPSCFIQKNLLRDNAFILHISGHVDFTGLSCRFFPPKPAPFGHMSFTTDMIDPKALIDLHTAGLKVGTGMLHANAMKLDNTAYKNFMENNYPALAFDDPALW